MTSLPRDEGGLQEPGPDQLVGLHVWIEDDEQLSLPAAAGPESKALSADRPAPHTLVGAHCWIEEDEALRGSSSSNGSDPGSKPVEIPLHQVVGINVWIENEEELRTPDITTNRSETPSVAMVTEGRRDDMSYEEARRRMSAADPAWATYFRGIDQMMARNWREALSLFYEAWGMFLKSGDEDGVARAEKNIQYTIKVEGLESKVDMYGMLMDSLRQRMINDDLVSELRRAMRPRPWEQ